VFPADEVYRCHVALARAGERERANAVEWLESTLDRQLFARLVPVFDVGPSASRTRASANPTEALSRDSDPWISQIAERLRQVSGPVESQEATPRMDLIEKVFLLQRVDFLGAAKSSDLRLLAAIAEEIDVDEGEVLLHEGQPQDAMYIVVRGGVELSGVAGQSLVARENTPFGTWSLIDSDPSLVKAKVLEPTRLLRVTRSDFLELLEDHPGLATGILQALARRMRSFVAS
jgi:hypothetical protein